MEPPAGFRGRGEATPLKLQGFDPSEDRGTSQICHPVKYSINCSNILLEKVFVCVAIAVIRASQLQGQGSGPGGCRAATYKVKL